MESGTNSASPRSTALAFALVATVALALAAFALHRMLMSPSPEEGTPRSSAGKVAAAPSASVSNDDRVLGSAGAPGRSLTDALRHPSEDYRNTVLLIAIRDAGHVCTRVVSAFSGSEAGTAWRVSCADAIAYLVAADGAGGMHVEPMPFGEGAPLEPVRRTRPGDAIGPAPLDEPLRLIPLDE